MAGASLRAFVALHSSGEQAEEQSRRDGRDVEMEDGTVPNLDPADAFEATLAKISICIYAKRYSP